MKRLIICCDGTWNKADRRNAQGKPIPTNVVRLAYRVAQKDTQGVHQIVYYDEGVGTGNKIDQLTGGLTGAGLEEHLFAAYRFLVANYTKGDEIFIFGFSRGAYTARSLAGLVRNSGVLRRTKVHKYQTAIDLYLDRGKDPTSNAAQDFRAENAVSDKTRIKCIGVWDTVGALGIPARGLGKFTKKKYEFHDTALSASVEHAFHALAIDERRAAFRPTPWGNEPKTLYRERDDEPARKQVIEQVWFCGAHSDVGGGYEAHGNPSLSDITLEWMMTKAAQVGLAVDPDVRLAYKTNADCCAPLHDSYRIIFGLPTMRQIGATTTEYLHRAALDRWEQGKPVYRPTALDGLKVATWLTRDPREEQEHIR